MGDSHQPLSEIRGNERRGRIRELLADYYVEEEQGHGLDARQTSTDPCDLDGAAFDVDQYMEEAMQGERMKQLLKKTTTIRGEVKTLDNDMQMLVYENYTKFISATDTIGKMKDGVEGMEDEMQSLAATITKISEGSNRINTNLSEHRGKIDKLTGVRRLVTKLQFLMELPVRLRQCVDEERYRDAISYYEGTKGVLERFKTTDGFGDLEAQIEESMEEIRVKLQARLRDPRADHAAVREARDALLDLGKSEEECMEEVDAASKGYLQGLLDKGRGGYEDPPVEDLEQRTDLASLQPFSDDIGSPFVYGWLRYVMLFDALFIQGQFESVEAKRRARLNGNATGPMEQYFELVAKELVPGSVTVELTDASPSWSRTPKPPPLGDLFFQLQAVGATVAAAERALPGQGLLAAGGLALGKIVDGAAGSCFATGRKCLIGVVEQMRRVSAAEPSADTEEDQEMLVQIAATDLQRCVDDCLNELKCLHSVKGSGVPDDFPQRVVECVHAEAGGFVRSIGEDLAALAAEYAESEAKDLDGSAATRSLCAAALCGATMVPERGLISAVAGALEEYFGAGSHPMYHGSTRGYSIPVQTEAMLKQRTVCLAKFVIRGAAVLVGDDEEGEEVVEGSEAAVGFGVAFGAGCAAFQGDVAPTEVRGETIAAAKAVVGLAASVTRITAVPATRATALDLALALGKGEALSPRAASTAALSEEEVRGMATMSALAAAAATGAGGVSAPSPPSKGLLDPSTAVGEAALPVSVLSQSHHNGASEALRVVAGSAACRGQGGAGAAAARELQRVRPSAGAGGSELHDGGIREQRVSRRGAERVPASAVRRRGGAVQR